jgi:hypothetical protein
MASDFFPLWTSVLICMLHLRGVWARFSFDDFWDSDSLLTEWIQRLGDKFFQNNGVPHNR